MTTISKWIIRERLALLASSLALGLAIIPAGAGRAQVVAATGDLLKCQKAVAKEGMKLLALEQKSFEKCYETLLKCEIMKIKGEHKSPDKAAQCVAKAAQTCTKVFEKIAKAKVGKGPKLEKTCAKVAIEDIQQTDGLGYGLLPCGAETTTPGFLSCLDQVLQPKTEIVSGQLAARIGTLLDAQGLGGSFPNLPRP